MHASQHPRTLKRRILFRMILRRVLFISEQRITNSLLEIRDNLEVIGSITDRREDSAREEDRLENAPSFRDHRWQVRPSAVVLINRVLDETDQETRLCRFLDHFLVGEQFHAHLENAYRCTSEQGGTMIGT